MVKRKHFFPSLLRVQARWAAKAERELEGKPSKLPSQKWKEVDYRSIAFITDTYVGGIVKYAHDNKVAVITSRQNLQPSIIPVQFSVFKHET